MSFELISYHLSSSRTVTGHFITTGGGVIASLVMGKLYDRVGLPVVLVAILVSSAFAPLVFLGSFFTALAGMVLWGVGYATQDMLFKAIVAGTKAHLQVHHD
jgi:predicted MFS family arabinose efflux permease